MKVRTFFPLSSFLAFLPLVAGATGTIEGYWQDVARRILFSREAVAGYEYGRWGQLEQDQAYPSAKHIHRSASGYEVVDLLYDDEYVIRVLKADDRRIEFTRTPKFAACTMAHACRLDGDELLCSLESTCREKGKEVVDWRGEERYVRRALCERDGGKQMQGIPVKCR